MRHPERPQASNDDMAKVIHLNDRDVRDAARLFRLIADAGTRPPGSFAATDRNAQTGPGDQSDVQELVARAKSILNGRRSRERYFNPAIFGEPAWEILLVLYITDFSGGRQTLGRLSDWIDTPATSVQRWVRYLEKEKFVARQPHPTDGRTTFLSLLPRGRDAMNDYLRAVPG